MARVLVVDDDNTIRHLIVMTLEGAGHVVAEAATGAEGVAHFRKKRPHVIITDIVMPADSLYAVIELHQKHPKIPFIVVSGLPLTAPQTQEAATLLHAHQVLAKPFRLAELVTAINEILAK